MIQFIELVPIEVINPNYDQEIREWIAQGSQIGLVPARANIRHVNKFLNRFNGHIDFEGSEYLVISGEKYKIECIGPKEFRKHRCDFKQNIYVQKLP